MSLIVNGNSYVDVSQADEYFSDKFGYDEWEGLGNDVKEKLLISAAQQLDALCLWYGEPVDPDQAMAFPRTPNADPVPDKVKAAQCEMAFAVHSNESTSADGGDPLTELTAGSVTLKFEASSTGNPLVSDLTRSWLKAYGLCSGGSTKIIPMELI